MMPTHDSKILISACQNREREARKFASAFRLDFCGYENLPEPAKKPLYILYFGDHRSELLAWSCSGHGPVYVDFQSPSLTYRRSAGQLRNELLAKAIGLRSGVSGLSVVDATAGLGRDALLLASLGCTVTLYERSPVIYCLLQDGLRRAEQSDDGDLKNLLVKLDLHFGEAVCKGRPDVVYLDPMFPAKSKKNLAGKAMTALQHVLTEADDSDRTLLRALHSEAKRVVVKRPRLAPELAGIAPTHRITGKSCRFDVYARKSLKIA